MESEVPSSTSPGKVFMQMDRATDAIAQDPSEMAAANQAGPEVDDGGGDDDKNLKKDIQKQRELVKRWFTWSFWRLIVFCSLTLLVFAAGVFPIVFKCLGKKFLYATLLFLFEMLTFLATAINYVNPKAAAAKLCLTLSVVMSALGLLTVLAAITLQFKNLTWAMTKVTDDLSGIFPVLSYLVIVFLIIQGLLEETASDWGKLALLASFLALGLAMGVSGIMKDMMSYVFIRANDYFEEQEYIYFGGNLLHVREITWLHTFAYNPKTKSDMFIPNNKLACKGINNQSRDNARQFGVELPIPGDATVEQASQIVKDMWTLIRSNDGVSFTAPNGKEYEGQFDIKKSNVYLSAPDTLTVKLFGKYYFSKPPAGQSSKPDHARQMEWSAGWNYQVESMLLEFNNIVSKHCKV